jgi:hypothetical protein
MFHDLSMLGEIICATSLTKGRGGKTYLICDGVKVRIYLLEGGGGGKKIVQKKKPLTKKIASG